MTTYSFFISTEPYKFEASDSLIEMSKSLIKKGHTIKGFFFFGTGVYNIKGDISCGSSIRSVPKKLEQFTIDNNIPVAGCSTWVSLTGLKESNFINGASEEGLGDFSNWAVESDKIIVFGTGG
ncbi:MAG: DsrE family protein [Candidatus Lokiarchaeota archaeon]|nr:DsrE family protein [Candidatus Lokiarchaeota archaeon]